VLWQLIVAFIRAGIITYQEKMWHGKWTKGKETISRPVHELSSHLALCKAAWFDFSNGPDALPTVVHIPQFSACFAGVCQGNLCSLACTGCKGEVQG